MPDARKLSQLDWVVPRDGTPTRSQFEAFFNRHKLPVPERIVECSSLIVTRGLLRRSDRVGIMSATQVHQEVENGQLRLLPFTLTGTERPIGLTTRKNWRPTIAMTRLLEIVRERSGQAA
jgi:DNA-binding transcriptional LysR family regulator